MVVFIVVVVVALMKVAAMLHVESGAPDVSRGSTGLYEGQIPQNVHHVAC